MVDHASRTKNETSDIEMDDSCSELEIDEAAANTPRKFGKKSENICQKNGVSTPQRRSARNKRNRKLSQASEGSEISKYSMKRSVNGVSPEIGIGNGNGLKIDYDNEDSASVDSTQHHRSPQQIVGLIEESLNGDAKSLKLVCGEDCESTMLTACQLLSDRSVVSFYMLLLQRQNISLFSSVKWIKCLMAERAEVLLRDKLACQESKPLEHLIKQRARIVDRCCTLRGKLDLILANYHHTNNAK